MSLIRGRVRLFCVSNIIASFACTGFLGPKYLADFQEAGQKGSNEVIAADEIIPLSQLGEGDSNIIERLTMIPDVREVVKPTTKNEVQVKKTTSVTKSTTTKNAKKTVTKSVVTKKEVKASSNYVPAAYSDVTGSAVVNYAKRYMGLKYVHAGRSLATGTDCSGFTSLIYREFGISLPYTVSGQVGKGTYVKKADLQKGDLVFYSSGSRTASHVGIYMGDGKVIHQSNPRDGVKISSVNMMHYITARRVINDTAKKIVEKKIEEEKKAETNIINTNTSNDVSNNVNNNVADNSTSVSNEKETLPVNETVSVESSTSTSVNENKESEIIMDNKEDSKNEVVESKTEAAVEKVEVKVEEKKEEVKEEIISQEQTSENTEN